MRAWWGGAAALALGLGWLITDQLLLTLFPLSWGGPNIGGGAIYAFAHLVAAGGLLTSLLAGVVLLVRRQLEWFHVLVPVLGNAALALGVVAVRALLPGDVGADGGLAGLDGQVGVSVDAAGEPVLVLEVCAGSVDTITVVGPNVDGLNEPVAQLRAATPMTSSSQVALLAPGPAWTGAPAALPLDRLDFVIASAGGRQSELRQVDFSASDLEELRAAGPGTVQYSTFDDDPDSDTVLIEERTSRAAFHDLACAGFPASTPGR